MLALPVVLMPLAFFAGAFLTARHAPRLAPTRTGDLAGKAVAILGGAAAANLVLNLYLAVRAASEDAFGDFDNRDMTVGTYLADTLWQVGLLLGIAVAVHLLAPPADDDETPS